MEQCSRQKLSDIAVNITYSTCGCSSVPLLVTHSKKAQAVTAYIYYQIYYGLHHKCRILPL
jgi:hypothetical protein